MVLSCPKCACAFTLSPEIYSTKKVKEISENSETKEHQSKQPFNFFYLFRYISSVEKDASFNLLALIPLLWHCVK